MNYNIYLELFENDDFLNIAPELGALKLKAMKANLKLEKLFEWLHEVLQEKTIEFTNEYLANKEVVESLLASPTTKEEDKRYYRMIKNCQKALKDKKFKEYVELLVANAFFVYRQVKPLRISRSKNDYGKKGRYGKFDLKFENFITLIDLFVHSGLFEIKIGNWNKEEKKGHSTRIIVSNTLASWFDKLGNDVVVPKKVDKFPIELSYCREFIKNDKKQKHKILCDLKDVSFPERIINSFSFYRNYNSFLKDQTINVEANEITVNIHFLKNLPCYLIKNQISNLKCKKLIVNSLMNNKINSSDYDKISKYIYIILYKLTKLGYSFNIEWNINKNNIKAIDPKGLSGQGLLVQYLESYCEIEWLEMKKELERNRYKEKEDDIQDALNQIEFTLTDFSFDILDKSLVRKFCRGNTKEGLAFRKGGRAYGYHQELPSKIRPFIKINCLKTIELDYAGLHLNMAYAQLGLTPPSEPYVWSKADEGHEIERTLMKQLYNITINALNRTSAIRAFSLKFRKVKHLLPKGTKPKDFIEKFEEYHKPLLEQNFLYSDMGVTFQYKDSQIMEAILKRLFTANIPGLPVHDSVIVEKKHEAFLLQLMKEEYKKMIGTEPVVC